MVEYVSEQDTTLDAAEGTDRRVAPDAPALPRAAGRRLRDASPAARGLMVVVVVAALALTGLASRTPAIGLPVASGLVALIFIASSIANVEIGRWLEGRTTVEQRPHKTLSVWAFATALTIQAVWMLPVVALTYAHAYWRGLRPAPWKWVGSATFVIIAGLASRVVVGSDDGVLAPGRSGLLTVVMAIVVFVAVESALFFAISRLNHPAQEVWLRSTLASPSFYLTEGCVLSVGALSVVLWSQESWFGVLLLPVYALVQRAALFEPLRIEAVTDDKTGLLRFEAWRVRTVRECERLARDDRPWALLLVDLDHFKAYNDANGHFLADETLVSTADALRRGVRRCDLIARFGGEEFVVFLAEASKAAAEHIASRVRAAIAECANPPVTASIGVAWVPASASHTQLRHALVTADRALYDAKNTGRNRVILHPITETGQQPSPSG